MSDKQQALLKLIKKIVKEEVVKSVKSAVNEVLAEHFVKVMTENKQNSSLNEVYQTETLKQAPPKINEKEKQEIRRKILDKVVDPTMKIAMSDMSLAEMSSPPRSQKPALSGQYVDDDDEGVDISKFLKKGE